MLAVLDEYDGVLQSLGSDLFGFLQNLGSIFQEMKSMMSGGSQQQPQKNGGCGEADCGEPAGLQQQRQTAAIANRYDISFSCVPEQSRLTLHFRTSVAASGYLWACILKVQAGCSSYYWLIRRITPKV